VLSGIILAGGDSSRMGSPKALLEDGQGQPFLTRIVESMGSAGLTGIVVVTGRHHDAIADLVERTGFRNAVRIVRNPNPSRGQLSSLLAGLEASPPDTEAAVVTLVDVPFVAAATIAAVIGEWSRTGAPIVRPSFRGRRGHPVVFDRGLFAELRQAPLDVGARAVVSAHYDEIVNVPVEDPGCLVDVDTPADYRDAIETGFGTSTSAPDAPSRKRDPESGRNS
jgi:molybdenum cofactor cytidylyltransferase